MDQPAVHFMAVFMAFFAIMNPIVNAPLTRHTRTT